jgi:hypothetical protein
MGKLNIAHHKSYHPYRRDNIERVRKDEEEAAQKEAEAEGRVVLADAEARLDLLRERAGLGKGKGKKKEDDMKIIEDAKASILAKDSNQGHINLFEDLEQVELFSPFCARILTWCQQEMITAVRASKKATQLEAEKGVPLAPSAKDLNPWYSERDKGQESQEDEKSKRLRYAAHTIPALNLRLPFDISDCGILLQRLGTTLSQPSRISSHRALHRIILPLPLGRHGGILNIARHLIQMIR